MKTVTDWMVPAWLDWGPLAAERLGRHVYWSIPWLRTWRRRLPRRAIVQTARRQVLCEYLESIGAGRGSLVMAHVSVSGLNLIDDAQPKTASGGFITVARQIVDDLLERLCDEFDIEAADALTLSERIEKTRGLMMQLTGDMRELCPEFPFVLHDGDRLIDGTIDLLCNKDDGVALFDYKFTEAEDAAVVDAYRGQMDIYCKATAKAFPDDGDPEASLVVVSTKGTRLVSLPI